MTQAESKNYYELLGVEQSASTDQIKEAYRELARIFHPDSRFYDEITGGETAIVIDDKAFKAITEAYNVLANPDKRRKYDSLLPKGLKGWDENETFEESLVRKSTQSNHRSGAYGVFGVVEGFPQSAFDRTIPEDIENLKPAVIYLKPLARLFNMLGIKSKRRL